MTTWAVPAWAAKVVVVVLATLPGYARVVRAQTMSLKNAEFVLSARSVGAPVSRILVMHILPNIIGPLLILVSMDIPVVITIEEGSIGGFATQVMMVLAAEGLLSNGTIVRPMYLPDRFVAHGAPGEQYEDAGLTARHIVAEVFTALKLDRKAAVLKAKA